MEHLNKKQLLVIGGLFGFICIVIIIFAIIHYSSRIGKIAVNIKYAPFISKVTLNDVELKNNSKNYLEPGKYTLVASLDEFKTITETVTINSSTTALYGMLEPASATGEEIKAKYINDYYVVESYYANSQIEKGNKERSDWPIIKSLPINNSLFSIGYLVDSDNHLTLTINTDETYLEEAITTLKSLDQDNSIHKYNINIKKPSNPFSINSSINSEDAITFIKDNLSSTKTYIINPGTTSDNYYYTTITTGSAASYNLITYRLILKKSSSTWSFISVPVPIVTTYNNPNVPEEILSAVNSL